VPCFTIAVMLFYIQSDEIKSSCGADLFFVVVNDSDHYIGGTENGTQFIEERAALLPYSFIGYLNNSGIGVIL